jgi:hypothetical protein
VIRNSGSSEETVDILFLDNANGNVPGPVVIGGNVQIVPAGGTAVATASTWVTDDQIGYNTITVVVDPSNLYAEPFEFDNTASTQLFVSTRWGDVNCDGLVNAVDALVTLRASADLPYARGPTCPEIIAP